MSSKWTRWHHQHIHSKVRPPQSGTNNCRGSRQMRTYIQCVLSGLDSCQFIGHKWPDTSSCRYLGEVTLTVSRSSSPLWRRSVPNQLKGHLKGDERRRRHPDGGNVKTVGRSVGRITKQEGTVPDRPPQRRCLLQRRRFKDDL